MWTPALVEGFICEREPENKVDRNAIKISKDGIIVEDVLRQFAGVFKYILVPGCPIDSKVTWSTADIIIKEILARNGKMTCRRLFLFSICISVCKYLNDFII